MHNPVTVILASIVRSMLGLFLVFRYLLVGGRFWEVSVWNYLSFGDGQGVGSYT